LDTVPFGRPIASAIRVSDSPSRSPSSIRTRSTADNRLHIFAIHHLYQSVAPVFPSKLESAGLFLSHSAKCSAWSSLTSFNKNMLTFYILDEYTSIDNLRWCLGTTRRHVALSS
jgi:hypothetical protein